MKGIIFTESNFHLTIQGIKKQTRRILKPQPDYLRLVGTSTINSINTPFGAHGIITPRYKVGEILYLKEPYYIETDYCIHDELPGSPKEEWEVDRLYKFDNPEKIVPFWENKLFMPEKYARHFIQITGVRAERLQDISEEDCFKEGIEDCDYGGMQCVIYGLRNGLFFDELGATPIKAYAALIDKINGKGTWESNPYVWVYDYELMAELSEK